MSPNVSPAAVIFILVTFAGGLYGWMVFAIVLHEMAHTLTARAVGFVPHLMTIGKGPRVFQRRIAGIAVTFHLFPLSGHTSASHPPLVGLWWRGSLFASAGLACDLVLLIFVSWLIGSGIADSNPLVPWNSFLVALVLCQLILILANVIPAHRRLDGAPVPNDGKQLFWYLTGRTARAIRDARNAYSQVISRYDSSFRVESSWLLQASGGALAVLFDADRDYEGRRFASAVEKYLRVLDAENLTAGERAAILDQLACIPVIHGDKNFLNRALLWAQEAHALLPDARTIRGTLGSLLVETGAYSQGIEKLMPLTSTGNEPIDRSISACYIAKAYHQLGDRDQAERWLRIGQEAGGAGDVWARIEGELSDRA